MVCREELFLLWFIWLGRSTFHTVHNLNSLNALPLCVNHLITHRNPHHPLHHLRGLVCTRTLAGPCM